ncbi:PhnA domain-containing protein [Ancylomarina longa]|uniref:PhnA protein n=1 Tax=Ancylomarina longa TaxID=2487017 RepID=A0A434AYI2_9BACT|nr:alkylphosphonate utilization protein [Ancylomarina longa]RUT79631.1 PhnA protein [Ancylomarina longa]
MSIEKELQTRSGSVCELCGATDSLIAYPVTPSNGTADQNILICNVCQEQIENPDKMEVNHWRCLNDSMWSTVPAVQVMAWRMLNQLRAEGWPQDLLDMLYLDEETLKWAKSGNEEETTEEEIKHLDSNGVELSTGDSVVLIKDLNVKGGGFTAKRGTAVRNIHLVNDNPEHIEGRVEGQQIVILTKFVKKTN